MRNIRLENFKAVQNVQKLLYLIRKIDNDLTNNAIDETIRLEAIQTKIKALNYLKTETSQETILKTAETYLKT